jgi:hypothetical protein
VDIVEFSACPPPQPTKQLLSLAPVAAFFGTDTDVIHHENSLLGVLESPWSVSYSEVKFASVADLESAEDEDREMEQMDPKGDFRGQGDSDEISRSSNLNLS